MATQTLSVIRIWAGMAWADGVIAASEAAALHRLIDAAQLSDDEKQEALGFVKTPVELDVSGLADISDDARKGIYRAACRFATVDDEIAASERVYLGKLRELLDLAEPVARQIEYSVPGI